MIIPKLSLVCPLYNTAAWLPELVDSLLAGVNSERVEVLFVDDNCPHGSGDICRHLLGQRAAQVRFQWRLLHTGANRGLGAARNLGVAQARGDYLGFVDSDDLLAPHYFRWLQDKLAPGDADIIEFGYREFRDGEAPPLTERQDPAPLPSTLLTPFHTGFFVWTRVYRRSLVGSLAFATDTLYEDVDYVMQAFGRAAVVRRYAEVLVFYRKRTGSVTAQRRASYASLLINLVNASAAMLVPPELRPALMQRLSRKSLLVLLKGGRIRSRPERREFYRRCSAAVVRLQTLADIDAPWRTRMTARLCRLLCFCGERV